MDASKIELEVWKNLSQEYALEDFWQPLYNWHTGIIAYVILSTITLIVGMPLLYNVYAFNNEKT